MRPPAPGRPIALGVLATVIVAGLVALRGREPDPSPPTPSIAAERDANAEGAPDEQNSRATPGWVEPSTVWLTPDGDHIRPRDCEELAALWGAPDRAQFTLALERAGIDAGTRARVESALVCDDAGCSVTPEPSVLEGLTTAQRVGLYTAMRGFTQAVMLRAPFSRPLDRPAFADDEGLTAEARSVLARGTFESNGNRYFSDLSWLCSRVTDDAGRSSFFRVLRKRAGIDLSLRLRATDDLDAIARWWGMRTRVDAVRARLGRALADGAQTLPLRELLPPMPSARAGTFAPRGTRFDCFWTALNFNGSTVEGGPMEDRASFDQAVARWESVPLDELRAGDVIAFRTGEGTTLHAAVYLADDFVFTKDGWSMHRPWEFGRLSALRQTYFRATRVLGFRRP